MPQDLLIGIFYLVPLKVYSYVSLRIQILRIYTSLSRPISLSCYFSVLFITLVKKIANSVASFVGYELTIVTNADAGNVATQNANAGR